MYVHLVKAIKYTVIYPIINELYKMRYTNTVNKQPYYLHEFGHKSVNILGGFWAGVLGGLTPKLLAPLEPVGQDA